MLMLYSFFCLNGSEPSSCHDLNMGTIHSKTVIHMARDIRCTTTLLHHQVRFLDYNKVRRANRTAYNNTEHIPPPVYQPPEHGSKVNPVQDWAAPPAGPPPANVNSGEASTAMQNVPLNPSTEGQQDAAPDSPIQPPRRGMFSRLNPFSK